MVTSSSRHWLVVAAAIFIPVLAWAETISTFGRIVIERSEAANSYTFQLYADNPDEIGRIGIICYAGDRGLGLVLGPPHYSSRFQRNQRVTVWSDKTAPEDANVTADRSTLLGLACVGAPECGDGKAVRVFAEAVMRADHFVAYSFGGKTATLEARHLPAARQRFKELCSR
jgi:hypothetical protein